MEEIIYDGVLVSQQVEGVWIETIIRGVDYVMNEIAMCVEGTGFVYL